MSRFRSLIRVLGVFVLVVAAWVVGRRQGRAVDAAPADAHAETGADAGLISLSPEAQANIQLKLETAEEHIVERTLLLNATLAVDPDREAFVSSRVQGKVTVVNANVGDVVALGQPLVSLQSLQISETPPVVVVNSPIQGVVLERNVTAGETVDPAKSLMHVADLSRILARAEVYEADLASVRLGQTARLRIASAPSRVFVGRVVRLSDAIDPVQRTLRLWIEVENTPERALKPEMFAQVTLVVATNRRGVAVPNEAIQSNGPERFVFVQNAGGFLRQNVIVGERDDRFTIITSGLIAGDMVVTRGAVQLRTVSLQPSAGGVQDESKPHTH